MASKSRVLWITPEIRGGIRTYTEMLWPTVRKALDASGEFEGIEPHFEINLERIRSAHPTIIHFQHEYGLFGGKNPPFYSFPSWVKKLRRALPDTRLIATAHSVLPPDYRYPVRGSWVSRFLRSGLNSVAIRSLNRIWGEKTWSQLDTVIVHSKLQAPWIQASGQGHPVEIPHFVPEVHSIKASQRVHPALARIPKDAQALLIFGFFSEDKGQDVAIDAMKGLPENIHLLLAGGVRRKADESYFSLCKKKVKELSLSPRVHFLDFIPQEQIEAIYARADLVLAPFRSTTGSGSLAQSFARGKPTLASDLPLNQEVNERVPHALDLFHSGDPEDLARSIQNVFANEDQLKALREGASLYARTFSAASCADMHVKVYGNFRRQ